MPTEPRKMTRSQFQQQFGMTVEDWLASQQAQKTQPQAGQSNDLYSDPAIRAAAAPAIVSQSPSDANSWKVDDVAAKPALPDDASTYTKVVRGVSDAIEPPKQVGYMAAGMVSAVPQALGLIDVAPALVSGIKSKMVDGKSFQDGMVDYLYGEDGLKKLSDMETEATLSYFKSNPDASAADLDKFRQQFLKSDEFKKAQHDALPFFLRESGDATDAIGKAGGLTKKAEDFTPAENALHVIGSAFAVAPAKIPELVSAGVTKAVGERVAHNLAVRALGRTAEALTPVTMPATALNVGINAGAGVALTEGVRQLQGDGTLFDYDHLFEQAKAAPQVPVAALVGLAAVAPGALGRIFKKEAETATESAVSKIGNKLFEGKPRSEQDQTKLKPQLGPTVGLADETSQATHAAQKFGATPEDLDDIEIATTTGSYHNRKETENRIALHGELEPGYKTVPLQDIERAFASMPEQDRVDATNYLFAIGRQQDDKLQLEQYTRNIEEELGRYANAKAGGNTQGAEASAKKLQQLQSDYQAIRADTQSSRPSLDQWSRSDVSTLVEKGNADPRFQKIRQAVQKYGDDLLKYAQRGGVYTQDELDRLRAGRPVFFKLTEQEAPGATGLRRRAILFANNVKRNFSGSNPSDQLPDTLARQGRDLSVRDAGKVNLPKDVVSSLREMTSDIVHQVQANAARKGIMEVFDRLPGAEGTLYRYHDFGGGKKSVSAAQFTHARPHNADDFVQINDGGHIRLVQFGDAGINNLMKFQPSVTLPILNGMRRTFQEFTTGLGHPAFAVTQMMREPWLVAAEKTSDRSFGYLNTFTKRLAEGSILDRATDAFDPTRMFAAPATIPVQVWEKSMKALAYKAARDLENSSGVFNAIGQMTGGKEFIQNIAAKQLLALEETSYGIMRRRIGASFGYMSDINRIKDDFSRGASTKTGALRTTYNMYKGLLESIHTSARVAFWQQNLGNLSHKYGGFANIPERELKRLELDTKRLGGDVGRRSKSKTVQAATSAFPYANTIVQGNRQLLASAFPNAARKLLNDKAGTNFLMNKSSSFWPVMVSSVLMPKVVSMAVMSQWPEADDWWYNKTPTWKRMLLLPIPTVEAIATRVQTGKWPEGDPSQHFYRIPLPPDFIPITYPFEAGLRATGLFGGAADKLPPVLDQMKEFVGEFAGLPMPPAVNIAAQVMGAGGDVQQFPLGGANSDKVAPNNSMSKGLYDMISAIGGTGLKNLADAYNVGELAMKDGDGIAASLGKAMRTWADNEVQGLPDTAVPGLYNAKERKYALTPDAEYVYKTQAELKPVFDQLTRERDSSGRAATAQRTGGMVELGRSIKDPALLAISNIVYDVINKKGDFKETDKQYSLARSMIAGLQRQRMSTSKYNEIRTRLVNQQQVLRSTQARILRDTEDQIREAVGKQFEQKYGTPFSFSTLSKLVRRSQSQ